MLVKIFDEEHEKDLELVVNDFLIRNKHLEIIDIKYTYDIESSYWWTAQIESEEYYWPVK